MFPRRQTRPDPWALAAGAAAGAGALAFAIARGVRLMRRRSPSAAPEFASELDMLEDAAVEVLRRDRQTGVCAIDVAAIAPGIIELTGRVPTQDAGQRAARLLHSLSGVRTVISRLEVATFEERLASARSRSAHGEPQFQERRWYGVRVGTGRRRQSADTEPDRTDDSVARRTRELEVEPAELGDAADGAQARSVMEPGDRPM
jgi:hypothetical protein